MLKCYQTKVATLDMCWKQFVTHSHGIEINDEIICTLAIVENTLVPFDSASASMECDIKLGFHKLGFHLLFYDKY